MTRPKEGTAKAQKTAMKQRTKKPEEAIANFSEKLLIQFTAGLQ